MLEAGLVFLDICTALLLGVNIGRAVLHKKIYSAHEAQFYQEG
jgi:hypothetical protein